MKGRNFVFAAVLVACGGAVTTVDGNKDVNTLPPADKDQLCRDVANYVTLSISQTDFKKFICGLSYSSQNDPAVCQANFQKCMNDPSKDINFSATINCTSFNAYLAKCPAGITVSEFTDCYKQYVDVIKVYASKMPICDRNAAQALAYDAVGKISSQCLQTLLQCSGTTPGTTPKPPPADAGVPADSGTAPPDSGGGG